MRYIPLDAKNRYVDTGNKYWNNKFLRSVQVILNVMKGPVMPGKQFFLQAFGRDKDEFEAILSMPEEFIRNRLVSNWKDIDTIEGRWMPYVREWMNGFHQLSLVEKELLISAIATCNRESVENQYVKADNGVKKLLEYHLEEYDIVAKAKIPSSK